MPSCIPPDNPVWLPLHVCVHVVWALPARCGWGCRHRPQLVKLAGEIGEDAQAVTRLAILRKAELQPRYKMPRELSLPKVDFVR